MASSLKSWWCRCSVAGLVMLGLGQGGLAYAADETDVVDAADDDDPFDLHIEPSFRQTLKRSKIRREYPCDPNVQGAAATDPRLVAFPRLESRCTEPSVLFNNEMDAARDINQLDVDVQIGLYKDVELHLSLPYVFSDQRRLEYTPGDRDTIALSSANSSVDPSDTRIEADVINNVRTQQEANDLSRQYFSTYRFFNLDGGNTGPSRSGFGDMTVGLAWNPFNNERDDTKATLKLQFDYMIPTGEVAASGNEGVGRGVHELQWTVASSKRFKYLEPYFALSYILPIASDGSLFQNVGAGQTLVEPGQRAEFRFGSEFIPYEDKEMGRKFAINIGLQWGFTAEGRDYSPLFDALNSSQCNDLTPNQVRAAINTLRDDSAPNTPDAINNAACRWILDQPANAENAAIYDINDPNVGDAKFAHDGILDHESYATFGATLGMMFQPSSFFALRANINIQHEQEHFLTAARTGVDSPADQDDTVKFDNPNERNPTYNPNLDSVGNRFRVEETLIFTWQVGASFEF